jgi:hypothetical protein
MPYATAGVHRLAVAIDAAVSSTPNGPFKRSLRYNLTRKTRSVQARHVPAERTMNASWSPEETTMRAPPSVEDMTLKYSALLLSQKGQNICRSEERKANACRRRRHMKHFDNRFTGDRLRRIVQEDWRILWTCSHPEEATLTIS